MMIDMLQRNHGKLLLLAFALALTSCRNSQPPAIEICILDGHGGGDCIEADGITKLYRTPSQMLNYWATGQPDMRNFSSWCYDTGSEVIEPNMRRIREHARGPLD